MDPAVMQSRRHSTRAALMSHVGDSPPPKPVPEREPPWPGKIPIQDPPPGKTLPVPEPGTPPPMKGKP
jgi:hypothetical protein